MDTAFGFVADHHRRLAGISRDRVAGLDRVSYGDQRALPKLTVEHAWDLSHGEQVVEALVDGARGPLTDLFEDLVFADLVQERIASRRGLGERGMGKVDDGG